MTVAIVDDQAEMRSALSDLFEQYESERGTELDTVCYSCAEDLLRSYRPFRFAAVFMDIFMDGMSGLDAASEVRKADSGVPILFLTTSDEFRPEAFRVHAYDYITKPVTKERLFGVLDELFAHGSGNDIPRLTFTSNRQTLSVPLEELVLLQASAHYVDLTDRSGSSYRTRMTFSEVSDTLAHDGRFLLLMRGVLVNMDFITGFGDGTCRMNTGQSIPFSIRKKRDLEEVWKTYKFAKIREEAFRRTGR